MPACYRKAFTLIEFLIALVIIGFIVAILVGVFSSPVADARKSSIVSGWADRLNADSNAIGVYMTRHMLWPGRPSDLVQEGIATEMRPLSPSGLVGTGTAALDVTGGGTYSFAFIYDIASDSSDAAGYQACQLFNAKYAGLAEDAAVPIIAFNDNGATADFAGSVSNHGSMWGVRDVAGLPAELVGKSRFCYEDPGWGGIIELLMIVGPM